MRKLKSGDMAQITKPVCVRRRNGTMESFDGRLVRVVRVGLKTVNVISALKNWFIFQIRI